MRLTVNREDFQKLGEGKHDEKWDSSAIQNVGSCVFVHHPKVKLLDCYTLDSNSSYFKER